ncbi:MAG: hypothetical protein V1836_03945 [Candidatus Aenigmatarchaeota archaeon]
MAQSASVPVRQYVRYVLVEQGEDPNFVRSVVGFADALFYSDAFGSRDDHLSRARKNSQRLGLAESATDLSYEKAKNLYEKYKHLPQDQKKGAKRFAIKYNAELKRRLQRRFRKLMGYSDDEIRLMNSAERIDLQKDIVYRNSDATTRSKIRERTLTRPEYESWQRSILEESDKLSFNVNGIDLEALKSRVVEHLSSDNHLRHMLNRELFAKYVVDLISGETLSAEELRLNGFNPEDVVNKARGITSNFRIAEAEKEKKLRNPDVSKIRFSRRGTNPIAFEEGWERHYQ